MTTEIMKSFSSLQDELEKAKDNLKAMDEHIKKLTGRDPGDMQTRLGVKRPANAPEEFRGRGRGFPLMRGRPGARPEDEEAPAAKKRPGDTRTVFSRLSGPAPPKKNADSDVEDELPNKPAISSRVIATPKEPPSRQEAMAAQSSDQRSHERNRRMFGALLGTLQKFRQEETRMKEKEEKRAKVERKLEENAKREKEELKRERQELFLERKRKQAEIRKIELKMLRIKEQDEWEAKHRHLLNFIQTRAKPHIFYLPKIHTVKTEERLVASQKVVAKMIEKKRVEVRQELEAIERRGRWRQGLGDVEPGQHSDDEQPMDILDKENRLGLIEGPLPSDASALNEEGARAAEAEGDVDATEPKTVLSAGGVALGEELCAGEDSAPSAVVAATDEATGADEATATATDAEEAGAATAAAEAAMAAPEASSSSSSSRRRRRRRGAHDHDDDDDEEDEDEDESEDEDEEERRRRRLLRISPVPVSPPPSTPAPALAPLPAPADDALVLPQRPRLPPRDAQRRASARSQEDDDDNVEMEEEDAEAEQERGATPPTSSSVPAPTPSAAAAPTSLPPAPTPATVTPSLDADAPEPLATEAQEDVDKEAHDEEDAASRSPTLPPVPGEDSPPPRG